MASVAAANELASVSEALSLRELRTSSHSKQGPLIAPRCWRVNVKVENCKP